MQVKEGRGGRGCDTAAGAGVCRVLRAAKSGIAVIVSCKNRGFRWPVAGYPAAVGSTSKKTKIKAGIQQAAVLHLLRGSSGSPVAGGAAVFLSTCLLPTISLHLSDIFLNPKCKPITP